MKRNMNCLDIFELPINRYVRGFGEKADLVVFQHVPKTAGSSINVALHDLPQRDFLWMESGEGHSWQDFLAEHQVQPFQILRGHLRKQHLDELVKLDTPFLGVTFIRHPIQQIVSHFRYCHSDQSARHEWHRNEHPNLESFIRGYLKENFTTKFLVGHCESVDEAIDRISQRFAFVGLTEYYNTGMYVLMQCIGSEFQVKTRVNATESEEFIAELLTDSVCEIIDRDYAIDLGVHRFFMQRYGDVAERAVEYMSASAAVERIA